MPQLRLQDARQHERAAEQLHGRGRPSLQRRDQDGEDRDDIQVERGHDHAEVLSQQRRLHTEMGFLRSEFRSRYRFDNIIGNSRVLRECLDRVTAVAATDATVSIAAISA